MATIKEMSAYFQCKHNLPANWEVYAWECVPKDEYTHMQLTGCLTDVFKRGPRKGQTKYTGEMEKVFILSIDEVDLIGASPVTKKSPQHVQSALALEAVANE